MESVDRYNIKSLESVSNIKYVVKETRGFELKTEVASGIAVCITQGIMFFDSAKIAPFEIKPLLALYGMIAFTKGLILERSTNGIETLKRSHGLKDISPPNSKIYDSSLLINKYGNFQLFNDVVSHNGEISLIDKFNENYHLGKQYDKSDKIYLLEVSLKEIMSRLTDLRNYYKDTFKEEPKILEFELNTSEKTMITELNIITEVECIIDNIEYLKEYINKLRNNYPFLHDWCFYGLDLIPWYSFNESRYMSCFRNIDKEKIDEFSGQFEGSNFYTNQQFYEVGYKPNRKHNKLIKLRFNKNEV